MQAKVTRQLLAAAAFLTLPGVCLAADDDEPPKVIQATDALAHATEKVTVEFLVENSNQIKDRNGKDVVFLNSMKDYRDEDNFTVVIFADALARFRKADIDDPAKHFRDKKVRVTGGIELRRGKPQIILKDPDQIKVVEEKPAE